MLSRLASQVDERIQPHLKFLYGEDRSSALLEQVSQLISKHQASHYAPLRAPTLHAGDAILISYPDQLQHAQEKPLVTLSGFLQQRLKGLISGVHLLPFYPSSSDMGFSVIDYRQVDPRFGHWQQIDALSHDFRLMFDLVLNHVSIESAYFQGFLRAEAPYRDFFLSLDPQTDLSAVVRPRDQPLLTPYQTALGRKYVWTTFGPDQADLNYANPKVLLEITDILLAYIRHGAQLLRLDAVAFLWKEPYSASIHLPQTHHIVQYLRSLVDIVAPHVRLITETNVPQSENFSYFGDGSNEAHLVYQFALPPLLLYTLRWGDGRFLTRWASALQTPSEQTTYFNFTASHDGIGLRPIEGLLPAAARSQILSLGQKPQGALSYRRMHDNARQAYELNMNYFDALTPEAELQVNPDRSIARFIASQAIMLALQGLPGIYFHSLFGSRGDVQALRRGEQPRAINREKLDLHALQRELLQTESLRARIFQAYCQLLRTRAAQPAFSPWAPQAVLDLGPHVFALLRGEHDRGSRVLSITEVAGNHSNLSLTHIQPSSMPVDLLSRQEMYLHEVPMQPYQTRWIRLDPS